MLPLFLKSTILSPWEYYGLYLFLIPFTFVLICILLEIVHSY